MQYIFAVTFGTLSSSSVSIFSGLRVTHAKGGGAVVLEKINLQKKFNECKIFENRIKNIEDIRQHLNCAIRPLANLFLIQSGNMKKLYLPHSKRKIKIHMLFPKKIRNFPIFIPLIFVLYIFTNIFLQYLTYLAT